jgi:hypothetical protein
MEPIAASRLRDYQSARVTIHYATQTYNDTGTITYMDDNWIELTKDNGERLLVPVIAIRIIKLLEAPKLEGEAAILLRPAEGQPPAGPRNSSHE